MERLILEARTSLEPKEMAQETHDGSWGRSRAGLQEAAWVHHQGSASHLRLGIQSRQPAPAGLLLLSLDPKSPAEMKEL